MAKIDAADARILCRLQEDASRPIAVLAGEVGLSLNACWKRIRRLEDDGIIQRRVALVDRAKVGLDVTVFVTVKTDQHDEAWLDSFAASVRLIPEVVEFYRMSGEVDYLLKIVCGGIDDYDRIYRKLIRSVTLKDVSGFFAMEQIKFTTTVPVEATSNRDR